MTQSELFYLEMGFILQLEVFNVELNLKDF